jgi:predicted O-linked N-acetylglucosamine transferase (SPINDLY family)
MTPGAIEQAMQVAIEHHQAGRLAEAEALYRQVLADSPNQPDALNLLGTLATERGEFDGAITLIRRAIAVNPMAGAYHHNLGETYRRCGQWDAAIAGFHRSIELRPGHAETHNNLGVALYDAGRMDEAIAAYRRAIALEPGHAWAHVNLANALSVQGSRYEAVAACIRALELRPGFAEAYNSLGAVMQAMGRTEEAVAACLQAIELRPGYAEAHNNLGNALKNQGRLVDAVAAYQRAIAVDPNLAEAHGNLILSLQETGQIDQGCLDGAKAAFRRALAAQPDRIAVEKMFATVLALEGRTAEAQQALERALSLRPSAALQIRSALLLPVIYNSGDEVERQRSRVEAGLARVAACELSIGDPIAEVGSNTFYLAYQGRNDRDLLATLAAIHRRATPALAFTAPHCRDPAGKKISGRIIRVGFFSAFFYCHTIGKVNLGFVRGLSRDRFSVTLLRFPGADDSIARAFQESADRVVTLPRHLELARERIASERLDVLYYADIGMEPWSYFLSHARLAPVQCATWGHASTTGIPTIDYFLSSTHLEPESAEEHYTEHLVRMDKINTCYNEPTLNGPIKDRHALGLDSEANLYICVQSLFKIHPDFDAVLGEILRRDPRGQVVFFEGVSANWQALLAARFRRSFPAESDRVVFLPRLTQDNFLQLLARVDLLLDTFPFGGGNTSLEALAFGTPIVTRIGRFLRGRITSACYRQMGISDCIAETDEHYVQIALRLAMDSAWRDQVRSRILARKHLLYNDAESVRELERFFVTASERASIGPAT